MRVGQGPRTRMREVYGSPELWRDRRLAVEGKPTVEPSGPTPGTLGCLIAKYLTTAEWSDFAPATRKQRHAVYRAIEESAGAEQIEAIDRRAILAGRDRRGGKPHAVDNFLRAMGGLLAWTVNADYVRVDPALGVKLLSGGNDDTGFHAWTEDELARFEERWAVGTRQRLAFDLLLYTGLRCGDAVRPVGRTSATASSRFAPRKRG